MANDMEMEELDTEKAIENMVNENDTSTENENKIENKSKPQKPGNS